jgi:Holliday junction resolvase RusA-like endonuclease
MITVEVEGRPAPKGSRIAGKTKAGNTYTRPASKYEKPWVDAVREATRIVMRHHPTPDPPYEVTLRFRLNMPQKPRLTWPTVPDVDKLARAVLDGLTQGGAIEDDRCVTDLTVSKEYAVRDEPVGVTAEVTSLAPVRIQT